MENQVLSIEQMQKLKELGVDIQPTGTCLMYTSDSSDKYYLKYGESTCEDDVKAFTLQDIIELLPAKIQRNAEYDLTIYKEFLVYSCEGKNNCIACRPLIFFDTVDPFTDIEIGLIGAAYEMLIWVAENGYLKTK